jgi:hypothetical protein
MAKQPVHQARDIRDALTEFVTDVEGIGARVCKEDWPDLFVTYVKACKALGRKPASTKKKLKPFPNAGTAGPASVLVLNNHHTDSP